MTATTAPGASTPARPRGIPPTLAVLLVLAVGFPALLAITSGAAFTDQLQNALTRGAVYALIALGYTMVYGIIELINFAHGDMFMVGSFVSIYFLTGIGHFTRGIQDPLVLAFWLIAAFAVAMLTMGIVGVVIERFAYRRLRNAPRLAPLLTAIGVSFILQNVIQAISGPSQVNSPQLIPVTWTFNLLGVIIPTFRLFVFLVAIVLMIALHLFINRTRLGRAMRSTAADRQAAQLMGVDINRTIAITFFIGSALAGAAGVVQGLYLGFSQFNLGFLAGLKAFTAAVLGGIGNTTGAALGGFMIGFIEVLADSLGYGRWQEAVVFAVLVMVLVFRPAGLLGQQLGERA